MTRTLTTALTAFAIALVAAAPASAGTRSATFVAYVSGKQTISWKLPRVNTYLNCQGQRWKEGEGTDTLRFQTKPMRIVVYMNGRYGPFVRYRKRTFLEGRGKATRSGRLTEGIEPGWCFSGGATRFDAPNDCGTMAWNPEVNLRWKGNRVGIEADQTDLLFRSCLLFRPPGTTGDEFAQIDQRYPVKDVFDRSQGLVEVLGSKTFSGEVGKHPVFGTSTTDVSWKLRLRRVR